MSENLNINIVENFKNLYESKKYDDSLNYLQKNSEAFDPAVYQFNLATVYLAKEDYLKARIHLEKSKDIGGSSNKLFKSLNYTKNSLGVTSIEKDSNGFEKAEKIISQLPISVFITLTLLLFILIIPQRINKFLRGLGVVLLITVASSFYLFHGKYERVISLEDKAVFSGPSKMFEQVQLLPRGTVFLFGKEVEGWVQVAFPKSHFGWITKKDIEEL
mgnify:CR=1 FL=1